VKQLTVELPDFPGFYNSTFESYIDHAIDCEREATESTGREETNYKVNFTGLARKACELFAHATKLPLVFSYLWSPREYNFQTDKIDATIHMDSVMAIYAQVPRDVLAKWVLNRHSSRSAFISFYSNDLTEWPINLADWDPNHLCTLLFAYFDHKGDNLALIWDGIAETMASNGNFEEFITFEAQK
jgi:hypothetical protein